MNFDSPKNITREKFACDHVKGFLIILFIDKCCYLSTSIFRLLMVLRVILENLLVSLRIVSSLVLYSFLLRTAKMFDLSAPRTIMSGWFLRDLAAVRRSRDNSWVVCWKISLFGKTTRSLWLTPYSMVWDWRVSRPGPMPFCWPSCSLLFCLQLFSLSLLFLYRLVVWGWDLRTDRVAISLSRPCIANLF